MKTFIEQQQELATKKIMESASNIEDIIQNYHGNWPEEDEMGEIIGELRKLTTNLGEELMRLAEGERKEISTYVNKRGHHSTATHRNIRHNKAIDIMKQHITSVTGVV